MTQDDIQNDPITVCFTSGGSAAEPGTDEVETVNVELRLAASKWAEAVASGTQAKVLIKWIEAQRVQ